jgi:hypothetical protein
MSSIVSSTLTKRVRDGFFAMGGLRSLLSSRILGSPPRSKLFAVGHAGPNLLVDGIAGFEGLQACIEGADDSAEERRTLPGFGAI